jgi:hypothetical protein
MNINTRQIIVLTICLAGLLSVAVFIWPTRYMYTHMSLENGVSLLVRVDRFTGKTEWFIPNTTYGGWKSVSPTPATTLLPFSFEPPSNMKITTSPNRVQETLSPNEKKKE